jgi:hypothetical protein
VKSVNYLLIADGSSDVILQHIINWLLRDLLPEISIEANFCEPAMLKPRPAGENSLLWKIKESLKRFTNIDILFIHRDAEIEVPQNRFNEIQKAVVQIAEIPAHICIVPVRMTEAWLLIDEPAIRYAAGNPNGKVKLKIPAIKRLEALPNPKDVLHGLLRQASEAKGRDLKRFRVYEAVHRVAELIDDYSSLRELSAFRQFESDLNNLLNSE